MAAVAPVLDRVGDFAAFLDEDADRPAIDALRLAKSTGRPVGAAEWTPRLEADTNRILAPEKRGPKPRPRATEDQKDPFTTVSPKSDEDFVGITLALDYDPLAVQCANNVCAKIV